MRSVLIETVQVFANRRPVENLRLFLGTSHNGNEISANSDFLNQFRFRLIAVSRDEVKSLPLDYCSNKTTCSACVRLQDPYCAWESRKGACVSRSAGWLGGNFVQVCSAPFLSLRKR